jgi:hypothetical protein
MSEANDIINRLKKPAVETVKIDGVGDVRLRHLKVQEMLELTQEKDDRSGALKIVAACVVDEADRQVFASAAEVQEAGWPTVKALADAAMKLNGLAGSAEKNSTAAPGSQ